MHEIGHNFNLLHSGGLDGLEYTDHTCVMGNPLYSDDVGSMCYNPAKNYQIGWYSDRVITWSAADGTQSYTFVGIADYLNNPAGHPVVVKLETNLADGMDYFVG